MKLYHAALSGNAYKGHLMLSLLGIEHDLVPVDLAKGESRTPEYLAMNPRGQIPVLVDGDVTIWDSQAILVYLARRPGGEAWLPIDAVSIAEVMQWMAFSENECLFGMARARAVKIFARPFNLEECQNYARAGLKVLDAHLAKHEWLAAGRPTIADVACYPYVALVPEGDVALDAYPNVLAWMGRIEKLPGYVTMKGLAKGT